MSNSEKIEKIGAAIGSVTMITGALVLLLVAGHFMIGIALWARGLVAPAKVDELQLLHSVPVFDAYANKTEFLAEMVQTNKVQARFEPYYHWRRPEIKGKYFNVGPDGVRRTVHEDVRPDAKKVFMLGGSTTWGTGVPDQATIASYLQARLGSGFRVYNFGETGWVSTQELNYLLYQLGLGNVPDYVIFYDGVNDGYGGAYSPAIPRDPLNLRERYKNEERLTGWTKLVVEAINRTNYKWLYGYVGGKLGSDSTRRWDSGIEGSVDTNSRAVITLYESHMRQVRALANEYGFRPLFVWQPNLFAGSRATLPYERKLIEEASPLWVMSQQRVYQLAKATFTGREHEGVVFLGDILQDLNEPMYFDWCHIGPRGNEIVAAAIARRIPAIATN